MKKNYPSLGNDLEVPLYQAISAFKTVFNKSILEYKDQIKSIIKNRRKTRLERANGNLPIPQKYNESCLSELAQNYLAIAEEYNQKAKLALQFSQLNYYTDQFESETSDFDEEFVHSLENQSLKRSSRSTESSHKKKTKICPSSDDYSYDSQKFYEEESSDEANSNEQYTERKNTDKSLSLIQDFLHNSQTPSKPNNQITPKIKIISIKQNNTKTTHQLKDPLLISNAVSDMTTKPTISKVHVQIYGKPKQGDSNSNKQVSSPPLPDNSKQEFNSNTSKAISISFKQAQLNKLDSLSSTISISQGDAKQNQTQNKLTKVKIMRIGTTQPNSTQQHSNLTSNSIGVHLIGETKIDSSSKHGSSIKESSDKEGAIVNISKSTSLDDIQTKAITNNLKSQPKNDVHDSAKENDNKEKSIQSVASSIDNEVISVGDDVISASDDLKSPIIISCDSSSENKIDDVKDRSNDHDEGAIYISDSSDISFSDDFDDPNPIPNTSIKCLTANSTPNKFPDVPKIPEHPINSSNFPKASQDSPSIPDFSVSTSSENSKTTTPEKSDKSDNLIDRPLATLISSSQSFPQTPKLPKISAPKEKKPDPNLRAVIDVPRKIDDYFPAVPTIEEHASIDNINAVNKDTAKNNTVNKDSTQINNNNKGEKTTTENNHETNDKEAEHQLSDSDDSGVLEEDIL